MGEMAQNVLKIGEPVFSQCPLHAQLFWNSLGVFACHSD